MCTEVEVDGLVSARQRRGSVDVWYGGRISWSECLKKEGADGGHSGDSHDTAALRQIRLSLLIAQPQRQDAWHSGCQHDVSRCVDI